MKSVDVDLHLHGRFARGVSSKLGFNRILAAAKEKGLKLIGSGDILHPEWRKELAYLLEEENGAYVWPEGEVYVLPQVEVEDKNRVHHVIIFRSFEDAEELAAKLEKLGVDLRRDGRPKILTDGKGLVELLDEIEALFGPAHAFTPYFGIYAHVDSVIEYYGERPHFLELGLSANSSMASRISELNGIPFLSNSDAHSGERLAREFQRMKGKPSFDCLKRFLIEFNAGLDPREGKYHLTACNRCYKKYTVEEAVRLRWRCPCGGKIKKGVRDRVEELADQEPSPRPPYKHILPLNELLSAINKRELYNELLHTFGSEIAVLVDVPVEEIEELDEEVGRAIRMMREGKILYYPGGGGKYGEIYVPLSEEEYERLKEEIDERLKKELVVRQSTLTDFF